MLYAYLWKYNIKSKLRLVSRCVFLEQSCQISSRYDLKRQRLRFLKSVPNITNNNNNKMSKCLIITVVGFQLKLLYHTTTNSLSTSLCPPPLTPSTVIYYDYYPLNPYPLDLRVGGHALGSIRYSSDEPVNSCNGCSMGHDDTESTINILLLLLLLLLL